MPEIGIGRGLSALLSESGNEKKDLREIPTDLVQPNPHQPRAKVDGDELEGLVSSISEKGVLQPVIAWQKADGNYELIAGERRWRAAMKAGLKYIPAIVRRASDPDETDRDSMEIALIENMVRKDLNPIEEARACAALVDELGLKVEAVGRRVGRSRSAVSNLIRLLELPDEVIEEINGGRLSEGHGRAILQAKDQTTRRRLAKQVVSEGLTVRDAERLAKEADSTKGNVETSGPRVVQLHHELEQSRKEAEDVLSEALGVEARVKVRGRGAKVELTFDDMRDIFRLAEKVSMRRAA